MQQDLGRAIRAYRVAKDWTTEDLAKASEVDKGTVNRVELGGNATVDTLLKLTRALGVELEIALRKPEGQAKTARDVHPAVTPSVSLPPEHAEAPGEEAGPVFTPSFPQTPVHASLYGFIADLTEDQARQLRRPLLELIEQVQQSPDSEKPGKAGARKQSGR